MSKTYKQINDELQLAEQKAADKLKRDRAIKRILSPPTFVGVKDFMPAITEAQYKGLDKLIKNYQGIQTIEWKYFKIVPVKQPKALQPKALFFLGIIIGLNFGLLLAALIMVLNR